MKILHWRAAALCGVLVLAAAGCSSSGSSGSSGTKQNSGSKSPIRLLVNTTLSSSQALGGITFPYAVAGAKAAAAAINKSGGIDGHKVTIDVCDNKGDPNTSAKCGRTAKSNGDIAVVGSFDPIGAPQMVSALEAAKIPDIGGLPATTAEYNSPISFMFDPGPVLGGFAISRLFLDTGCKHVVQLVPTGPGADVVVKGEQALFKQAGAKLDVIMVSAGTADVTPLISTALSKKPDCFSYTGDGQTNIKFILGARKQGYKGKILTAIGSLLPQFLKVLGPAGDDIYVLNSTVLPNDKEPMTAKYSADMMAYYGGDKKKFATNANEFSQDSWSSVELVKQALTGGKEFTSAALLKKLPTMCDVNVGNVYPHLNFCKPVASKTLTRVFNDHWQYFKSVNGEYQPIDGKWQDLTDTIPK